MRRLGVLTLGLAVVTSGHVALAEDAPSTPASEMSTSVPTTVATPAPPPMPEQATTTAPPGTTPPPTDGATVTTIATVTDTGPTAASPTATSPPAPAAPAQAHITVQSGQVGQILATIRYMESRGNYTIAPNRGNASGAYQFIQSTWNGYGGYSHAYLAPTWVQDERAAADVNRFLAQFNNDVSMVPVMWYYPRAAYDHSWMDRVPNPAGGNRLTIREYQSRWLERLAENATTLLGTYVPAPSTPAAVSVLSDLPEPDPVTIDPITGEVLPAATMSAVPAPTAPPMSAVPAPTAPPIVIPVDVITVSEPTMQLAARSVPPKVDVEDGLGSMRSIVFPVLGPVAYADGWGDPRSGGRRHEGTDIVGVRMQPILAVVDGVISRYQPTSTGIRGVAISIADEDGWRYNYFHNNDDTPGTDDGVASDEFRLAPGLRLGDTVVAGQIIAYMGDSGNAEESVAHLHIEFRDPDGRARPSYWSLRAAEARQACTIGIGPWSTPTLADETALSPEPVVEHTIVTPMYGDGQWVIDSDGRVTATGDAALIMPRRDLQCDLGPATPFGTDSAGWDAVEADVLDGTVLADADLADTVLDDVVPDKVIPSLLPLASRMTSKLPPVDPAAVSDAGPLVDAATATFAGILTLPGSSPVAVDGSGLTVDGESIVDDPIGQPMAFTDPATGEAIIVVFDLPPQVSALTMSGFR